MDYLTMSFLALVLNGFNTFAVKMVSQHLHPALILVTKFGVGGLFLFFYMYHSQVPLVWNRHVFYGCLIGIWWAGTMVLYYTAIARGPLSVVIPIFNMNLIIPALLGFIFLNEPVTFSKILGLIFACLALVLLAR